MHVSGAMPRWMGTRCCGAPNAGGSKARRAPFLRHTQQPVCGGGGCWRGCGICHPRCARVRLGQHEGGRLGGGRFAGDRVSGAVAGAVFVPGFRGLRAGSGVPGVRLLWRCGTGGGEQWVIRRRVAGFIIRAASVVSEVRKQRGAGQQPVGSRNVCTCGGLVGGVIKLGFPRRNQWDGGGVQRREFGAVGWGGDLRLGGWAAVRFIRGGIRAKPPLQWCGPKFLFGQSGAPRDVGHGCGLLRAGPRTPDCGV